MSHESLVAGFAARLCAHGLDLVRPFAVADVAAALGDFPLETFGQPRALGLVVGNSRALWPRLLAELPEPMGEHPVDEHCARALSAAAAATGLRHTIYPSHVTEPRAIPIQRIAAAAGLADLSPSHLSVHPQHGPWIALRAVVTFDAEGPPLPEEPPALCARCDRPCMAALDRALAVDQHRNRASIAEHQKLWIAVRDACPVGRDSRYGADQIGYHYGKDRALLRRSQ